MTDVKARVARGADWLDDKYPGWFKVIDLAILDIADCHQCILGQVYTGCIPVGERGRLIAQVAADITESCGGGYDYWTGKVSTDWGGYNILNGFYILSENGRPYGFAAMPSLFGESSDVYAQDYQALLDEWTRVIIERRLAEHPEVLELMVVG